MIQFVYRKLEDILQLSRGFDITKVQQTDGAYPVISSSGPSSFNGQYKCKGPGVITGRKGTLGKVFFTTGDYWPHDTTLWVKDFRGNDPRYIYYLLKQLQLETFDVGASNPTLNRNHIHKLLVPFPSDLPTQQRIADVLSAYDELIEVNNQRIRLLEDTAHQLYKEWFVRLRFPGHEQMHLNKGLPEGWRVGKVGEVFVIKTGKLNSNAAKEDGQYPFFTCSNADFKTDTYSFDTEAVLLAGNNAAGVYPLKYYKGKFDAYQRTYIIKPKHKNFSHKYVYYYFLNNLEFLQTISVGAATQFLTTQMLHKLPVIIPTDIIMANFSAFIDPVFDQIQTLKGQNSYLSQTRDRLLPRLISGNLSGRVTEMDLVESVPVN